MRRAWPRLTEFPTSARLLCTAFFLASGLGFIFSELSIFHRHHRPGKWVVSISKIMEDYHGDPQRPLLVRKISEGGSMAPFIAMDPAGRDALIKWALAGAPQAQYGRIAEILQMRCLRCHQRGGQANFAPFDSYEGVKRVAVEIGGVSLSHLLMSSHIHMLGISFIFAFTGLMLLFSDLDEKWKALLAAAPFAALTVDIGSWWATRYLSPLFAYTIVLGGTTYAFLFFVQFVVVMYDLWLRRRPPFNAEETLRG